MLVSMIIDAMRTTTLRRRRFSSRSIDGPTSNQPWILNIHEQDRSNRDAPSMDCLNDRTST